MSCKTTTTVGVLVLLAAAPVLFGALAAIGPINPQNGFPLWVQDTTGTAVEIGLDPLLNVFDPPIAGNAFSQQIGFGAEAFYWSADAIIDIPAGGALPTGGQALLVLALEAAFANELPADGDQFLFGRIRIRVDTPQAGTYTVTHPFGTQSFTVAAGGVNAINETIDVGGNAANNNVVPPIPDTFRAVQAAPIGPFLRAVNPAPPAGFLGNPLIDQTVTGSPTGNNLFRVTGPGLNVQTDLFAVQGKIATAANPPPGTAVGAMQAVINSPFIDVVASATPTADLTAEIAATPAIPGVAFAGAAQKVRMFKDAAGNNFVRLYTPAWNNLPPQVTITTADGAAPPTTAAVPLTDKVTVHAAVYNVNNKVFYIVATSTNLRQPYQLTEQTFGAFTNQFGTPTNHVLIRTDVQKVPTEVTVTSAGGGKTTAPVTIVGYVPPTTVP